jgi:hypothetical protein
MIFRDDDLVSSSIPIDLQVFNLFVLFRADFFIFGSLDQRQGLFSLKQL